MFETNIEVCPFCGASPKMKREKISKLIGSPQPQKYVYYYTCTCDKVVAASANDCVMTSQEAIDYASYLWNIACQRAKPVTQSSDPVPAEEKPVKVEVTKPTKKSTQAKKAESLGSFVETVTEVVAEKVNEPETVKAEPEAQEPATETPAKEEPVEETEQEVVDTQPEQEEPAEPEEQSEPVAAVKETPKSTKSTTSNPMLASLEDILDTNTPSRKKSTKKD